MLKVGLTGSIAVGKSSVSQQLQKLGCHIIDGDQLARNVVEPNTPAFNEIVELFGTEILTATGSINRQKLGAIVFNNAQLRIKLNSIVHPHIHSQQHHIVKKIEREDPNSIVIVDAALLIESGNYKDFDYLIVVWCTYRKQIRRLQKRDNLSRSEAVKRIRTQMLSTEKCQYADYKIDTSGTTEDIYSQIRDIYENLCNKLISK